MATELHQVSKEGHYQQVTTTAWEDENLAKVDDPDVFEFSCDSVSSYNISNLSF